MKKKKKYKIIPYYINEEESAILELTKKDAEEYNQVHGDEDVMFSVILIE